MKKSVALMAKTVMTSAAIAITTACCNLIPQICSIVLVFSLFTPTALSRAEGSRSTEVFGEEHLGLGMNSPALSTAPAKAKAEDETLLPLYRHDCG